MVWARRAAASTLNIQLEKEKEHLDQFIYKTTHDLRSPIHSAMGLLNLLEKAPESERALYLKMTRNTLMKLESLIEEVNQLYKVGKMAVKREEVDLRKLLEGEIAVLKNYPSASNIQFELNHADNATLFLDTLRVRTILSNILSNAVKYSIRKLVDAGEAATCAVVYIGKNKSKEFENVKNAVTGKPVLTITDSFNLGKKGSCINLKVIDDKLKFEINQNSINSATLKVASQLASMAIMI